MNPISLLLLIIIHKESPIPAILKHIIHVVKLIVPKTIYLVNSIVHISIIVPCVLEGSPAIRISL